MWYCTVCCIIDHGMGITETNCLTDSFNISRVHSSEMVCQEYYQVDHWGLCANAHHVRDTESLRIAMYTCVGLVPRTLLAVGLKQICQH